MKFLALFFSAYLLSWIPATCCVTNDCCFEIDEKEILELPNQQAKILATGQTVKYNFSPDGKFYRCACNYNNELKHWVVSHNADTRCLFIPPRGS